MPSPRDHLARRFRLTACLLILGLLAGPVLRAEEAKPATPAPTPSTESPAPPVAPAEEAKPAPEAPVAAPPRGEEDKPAKLKDPYKDLYEGYEPPFLKLIADESQPRWAFAGWIKPPEQMEISSEKSFYTLNLVEEDARANALIATAIEKEQAGAYRPAMRIYDELFKKVLKNRRNVLYRVSDQGVFVPVDQYVQRRILNFPPDELALYRTTHDAEARESFETAKRKYSLVGFTEITERLLATSWGDNALLELGNAALDQGHYLAALEYFLTLRDFFPKSEAHTPELDLTIALCRKLLGETLPSSPSSPPEAAPAPAQPLAKSRLAPEALDRLKGLVANASYAKPPFFNQCANAPHQSSDDYTLQPPTSDPLALQEPVWRRALPGSRRDFWVFSQPVATDKTILYRHKNILYAHALVNGELRWRNDMGGRTTWQSRDERMYPMEDLLVQDGLVFTPLYKVGASLVALDEITGQVRWAYGPIAAEDEEQTHMRFESAPAGGPNAVYATYILDRIEGQTHTDTEYGVIGFESGSGRVLWRAPLCRMLPGKFSGGFAENRRNRIRSFASPPLYHQGTVYVTTNSGAIAAIDALCGRIKWLMRYPYWPEVHDATREFGKVWSNIYTDASWRPHYPMFWFGTRPLLVGERLYVTPVDAPMLLCIDRRTGRVVWSRAKPGIGYVHFLGPISTGELVLAVSGREVELLNPETGETTWKFGGLVPEETAPLLKHYLPGTLGGTKRPNGMHYNKRYFEVAARPYLGADDTLYVTSWSDLSCYYTAWQYYWPNLFAFQISALSLKERKMLGARRYFNGELMGYANYWLNEFAPAELKAMEDLPHKDEKTQEWIRVTKDVLSDRMPVNKHPPFMPFARLTFTRMGVPFELHFGPREVSVNYDKQALRAALEARKPGTPENEFALAELAIAESRLRDAAAVLSRCLERISSEDLDFRAQVKQQLFLVHERLARSAIRAADPDAELAHAMGLSRTANTLDKEILTLFVLSEAYARKGDAQSAARCLQSIVKTYGHYEYPVAALATLDAKRVLGDAQQVLETGRNFSKDTLYGEAFVTATETLSKGLPLYYSALSPLPRNLYLRAGQFASAGIAALAAKNPDFAAKLNAGAEQALAGKPWDDQLHELRAYPGTPAAQKTLDGLFEGPTEPVDLESRKRLWKLADAARVARLHVPEPYRRFVEAPPPPPKPEALQPNAETRKLATEDEAGTMWLALERRDDATAPNLLFAGGRVKKKLDNKFVLKCLDLDDGKTRWTTENIRLKGRGQEDGFFEAFVFQDLVVVHGLYDAVAFQLADGKERWHFRAPFDFEIEHAEWSGDLLMLASKYESLALFLATGEVAWQAKEQGDLYIPPYMVGDRLVSVRKLPFSVTVRYRATGNLIGRLNLPDLSLKTEHPLLDDGPPALPVARDGPLLVVTDGFYYIALDVETLAVRWKRLIDSNDPTREPPMRLALGGGVLVATKDDFDMDAMYVLDAQSGDIRWRTPPPNLDEKGEKKKEEDAPPPDPAAPKPDMIMAMHEVFVDGGRVYGLELHPGQGYYLVCRDAKTGTLMYREETVGYDAKPKATMDPRRYGGHAVVRVEIGQHLELKAYDLESGKLVRTLGQDGVGPFGVHGRASAVIQHGRLVLLTKSGLSY